MNQEEKLTFQDIAGYLPYKVPFVLNQTGIFNLDSEFGTPYEALQKMYLSNLIFNQNGDPEIEIDSDTHNWGVGFVGLDEVYLVLKRPQDLTQEELIKVGYAIRNYSEVTARNNVLALSDGRSFAFGAMGIPVFADKFSKVQSVLNEIHFDYNNLIEKGLALSINDQQFKK